MPRYTPNLGRRGTRFKPAAKQTFRPSQTVAKKGLARGKNAIIDWSENVFLEPDLQRQPHEIGNFGKLQQNAEALFNLKNLKKIGRRPRKK